MKASTRRRLRAMVGLVTAPTPDEVLEPARPGTHAVSLEVASAAEIIDALPPGVPAPDIVTIRASSGNGTTTEMSWHTTPMMLRAPATTEGAVALVGAFRDADWVVDNAFGVLFAKADVDDGLELCVYCDPDTFTAVAATIGRLKETRP